jgi:hypothetical protein
MSVMSVAKRPGALVRPLRAGNPTARSRPGEFLGCEPSGTELESQACQLDASQSAASQSGNLLAGTQRAVVRQAGRRRLAVVPAEQRGVAVIRPAAAGQAPTAAGQAAAAPSRPAAVPGAGRRLAVATPFAPPTVAPTPAGPPRVVAVPAAGARPVAVPAGGTRVAPVTPRGSARSGGKVRLTRRGRVVVWVFAVLAAAAVLTPFLLTAAAGAQAANHGLSPAAIRASMRQVVVKPGQSLWSIALQAEPNADPRIVSQQIIEYNALGSEVVIPGESLWVPKN